MMKGEFYWQSNRRIILCDFLGENLPIYRCLERSIFMAEYLCEADMSTGEYISRDEALKIFHQCCDNCTSSYNGVMCRACADADAMDILVDIPAADVQPIKHGRWIDIYEYCEKNGYIPSGMGIYYWCSECGKSEKKTSDFCPNCGARMDGDSE